MNTNASKRVNRNILIGLLIVFGGPLALAVYCYHYPQSALLKPGQHGQLIVPATSAAPLLPPATSRAWKLALITTHTCATRCEALLHALHRLTRSTGTHEARLRRWLVSPNRVSAFDIDHYFQGFVRSPTATAGFVSALPRALGHHEVHDLSTAIYIIDPDDRLVMVYPQDVAFKALRVDVMRLLKASRVG